MISTKGGADDDREGSLRAWAMNISAAGHATFDLSEGALVTVDFLRSCGAASVPRDTGALLVNEVARAWIPL